MPGWLWSTAVLHAFAGNPSGAPGAATRELSSCCSAVGAGSCPAELFAVGPGTRQNATASGLAVSGGWTLRCETGATFEANRTVTIQASSPKAPGAVLGAIEPAAAACFVASCVLPEGLCLRTRTGAVDVVACADGSEPSAGMWNNPAAVNRAPDTRVASAGAIPPSTSRIDVSLPPLPSLPCVPSPALREPSNAQVDQGNDAIVRGDLPAAVDRYQAAITINRCNAYAWAALGDALLASGNPAPARPALQAATGLMPTHFHAWTRLGEANERMGDGPAAHLAFQKALDARPGYPPAAAGLARTR